MFYTSINFETELMNDYDKNKELFLPIPIFITFEDGEDYYYNEDINECGSKDK